MKAYRLDDFTGLDDLRLHDEDEPRPQRGELVVRVHAVSPNFRDIAMGRDKDPLPHARGLIPVSDAAGEVVAIGGGGDAFKIGDRVMGTFHPRWYGGRVPPDVFKSTPTSTAVHTSARLSSGVGSSQPGLRQGHPPGPPYFVTHAKR